MIWKGVGVILFVVSCPFAYWGGRLLGEYLYNKKHTPLEEVSVFKDTDRGICFYVTEQIFDGHRKIISIDSVECKEVK